MAATKFSVITTGNNPSWQYRDWEETKLVCVVESWKLYPNKNEKNDNNNN